MPVPVSSVYDELMHYTTFDGLSGIVSSGCLWATDANFLNDAREISHYFDARLQAVVEPEVRKYAHEVARDPETLARIVSLGGFDELIKEESAVIVSSLRDVTLKMNRPFVLSLCGAPNDRIRRSGLLSQWRGYGADGGYALVFDSKGIEAKLELEAKSFSYTHVQMGDVFYEGIDPDGQPAKSDFDEMEAEVKKGASQLLRKRTLPADSPVFYRSVTSLSCLFKHWGFWEEREIRVVAIPIPTTLLPEGETLTEPLKEIKHFCRRGVDVPYIELFVAAPGLTEGQKLPLKRVIVGPHRDSTSRIPEVIDLLRSNGYDAEVIESEIPYVGR